VIYYVLLILMSLLGSVASLFLKKASDFGNMTELVTNKNLYIGGFLYVASAIINVVVLAHIDYSTVLPLTSLTYVWTVFLSAMLVGEKITSKKVIGVLLIFVGAVMVAI